MNISLTQESVNTGTGVALRDRHSRQGRLLMTGWTMQTHGLKGKGKNQANSYSRNTGNAKKKKTDEDKGEHTFEMLTKTR